MKFKYFKKNKLENCKLIFICSNNINKIFYICNKCK